jgi:hypothetical protein
MFKLDSFASRLMFTTTRITAHLANGATSMGTGFFFHFKVDDQNLFPVLITNKHVVANAVSGEFLVHETAIDPDGHHIPAEMSCRVIFTEFEKPWIGHPGDTDICGMPLAPLQQSVRKQGTEMFYAPIDESILPTGDMLAGLSALEEVVMVGYPIGLCDEVNNLPILRRGITASHPAVDFQGEPVGLIDIAAWPGSSGSPVLILNEGSYFTPEGLIVGQRILLLGTLDMLYHQPTDGHVGVVPVPTQLSVRTSIPIHLGHYIKASELLVLKDHMLATLRSRTGSVQP